MSNPNRDDVDRSSNARLVRNLALSLSGGALLTVLGATVAHADDAATASAGDVGTKSGDATAVGNTSGTQANQGVAPSGQAGGVQITNQQASATNLGIAVANTGGNIAIGNSSTNNATGDQAATGTGGLSGAVNNGSVGNSSNGGAFVVTGDATAHGNVSQTSIDQTAGTPASGSLGGLLLQNQTANVVNAGAGVANTGGNLATGNSSNNGAGLVQEANNSGGLATNSGSATNTSDGKATIHTGDAKALGNSSGTKVNQDAVGGSGDGLPGGLTIINQNALPLNLGLGVANSGGNIAEGNASTNVVALEQDVDSVPVLGLPLTIASSSGDASNESNGNASIVTGDAHGTGNESNTHIEQVAHAESDLSVALVNQNQVVLNAGLGIGNSGLNFAGGNGSVNSSDLAQDADIEGSFAGVASNQASVANVSDGSASITTGDAHGTGNRSETHLSADATATADDPLSLLNQTSLVGNVGVGVGNSGLNAAVGNVAETEAAGLVQEAEIVDPAPGDVLAAIATNSADITNGSDGSATITTGDAHGTGNDSTTTIDQVDPNASNQLAVVANLGGGFANSGANLAAGNVGFVDAEASQSAVVEGDDLTALQVVASNGLEVSNTSDGSAAIHTGDATGTGNHSTTAITQDANGTVDGLGLVLGNQVAGVANVGLGIGNSGVNVAIGNASTDNIAAATQVADLDGDAALVAGQVVASNTASVANDSDGSATIHTGDATGTGNQSWTSIDQDADGAIEGLGLVVNTQAAGVLNAGVGLGNSGVNLAVGNVSTNEATADQEAVIDAAAAGDPVVAPQVLVTNQADVSNTSDASANIGTGNANGSGNTSRTSIAQDLDTDVDGLGTVLGTQLGGVANVGLGIANSGANLAVGNASTNTSTLIQDAVFEAPAGGALVLGPVLAVGNQGESSNSSDGEACVCTGNATASGNVSDTTLGQDLDLGVEDGLSTITQAGGVLNGGVGFANSGLNLALGNVSTNDATTTQTVELDPAATSPLLGAQVFNNSGGATNSSDGTGKVGTGNASGTGNLSSTTLAQDADVDGSGAFDTQLGTTTNTGAGLANAGLSVGVGNASTNSATLTQAASGSGIVTNQGEASNESDGTGVVGDPNCEEETTTAPPKAPGAPGLPKTGSAIELEVLAAVMLMLAGIGIRRTAKHLG